jgi:hypothetical protein
MTGFPLGRVLKFLLIFGVCALVIVICANEIAARGFIPKTQLQQAKLDQITWQNIVKKFQTTTSQAPSPASQSAQVAKIWQQAGPQLSTLKDRGLATADVARKFIQTQLFSAQSPAPASNGTDSANSFSGPSPTLAPLEQRAIEYAKYLYCKETVEAYEKLNPELNN